MQPNEPAIPGALAVGQADNSWIQFWHSLQETIPERPLLEKTEKTEHHYLRRWQIWAKAEKQTPEQEWDDSPQRWGGPPVQYAWKPYDPSSVQPAPPREDIDNYFYLNIRYKDRDGTTCNLNSGIVLTFSQRNLM
jgi:hypothetical protein